MDVRRFDGQLRKAGTFKPAFDRQAEPVDGDGEDPPKARLAVDGAASVEPLRQEDGVPDLGAGNFLAACGDLGPPMSVGNDQRRAGDGLGVSPLGRNFGHRLLMPLLPLRNQIRNHLDGNLEQQRQEPDQEEAQYL